MNNNLRQGAYFVGVIILAAVNGFLEWFSWFEYLFLCCLFMIIVKLADIEQAIQERG